MNTQLRNNIIPTFPDTKKPINELQKDLIYSCKLLYETLIEIKAYDEKLLSFRSKIEKYKETQEDILYEKALILAGGNRLKKGMKAKSMKLKSKQKSKSKRRRTSSLKVRSNRSKRSYRSKRSKGYKRY